MAHQVAKAMDDGEHLLVQAGTGTGKSLAYLVPALRHALATDQPVLVATATLALQAQLVDRDLPRLSDAVEPLIGRPLRWATVKGRANYACLLRVHDGVPDDDQGVLVMPETVGATGAEVLRAREWAKEQAQARGTGDRDRLEPGVSDRAWRQVSVSPRECLGGSRCPYGSDCFAERSRREAVAVDIVVTNHAMLAVDAIEGLTVLPEHDVVVIDEGHELVARVTSVATDELWPAAVERAAKRVRRFVDDGDADELLDAAEQLRDAAVEVEPGRLDTIPEALLAAVVAVRDAARSVQSGLARSADGGKGADTDAVRKQAKALVDETFSTAERIAANTDRDVVWLESSERSGPILRVAPLSVAGLLRHRMFASVTGVLTSATLAIGGSFDSVARSVGLGAAPADDAAEDDTDRWAFTGIDVGSPFDYRRQAILYVARHLPTPGRDGLSEALLDELAGLVEAAGGRTLGLFSSRRAAEQAAEAIRRRLPDLPVLCQGDDLVPTLVRRFASDPDTSLFGTLSLWQGVDVPGRSCQLVVIDRLPFPRPDDPLMSARQRAVERSGGNGFMTVAAAHAALLLAQGTGRLIRQASDRGVVAVLDPRLATARYAGFLRASLPPMWPTTDRSAVLGALQRLTGVEAGAARAG